jgi:4-hydroxy-L-threonine phosphate dehydrogenase PdxA
MEGKEAQFWGRQPILPLTMGDPVRVGPEIIVKALKTN